jgi:primosomal protein N' (replication factor Y)
LRVARRFRWQVLLKLPIDFPAMPDLSEIRALLPSSVSLTIDVDPVNLM